MPSTVFERAAAPQIGEIAELLALALVRQTARQSSHLCAPDAENSLDISLAESGHPTPAEGGMADG